MVKAILELFIIRMFSIHQLLKNLKNLNILELLLLHSKQKILYQCHKNKFKAK